MPHDADTPFFFGFLGTKNTEAVFFLVQVGTPEAAASA